MKKSDLQILVVDDDSGMRAALTEAITRMGYKANVISKSEEALNAVKIKPYHAAVIDCMLPKMNGVELAKAMRSTRFGSAPIILMSGVFRDRGFAHESMEKTKAIQFLNKPFSMDDLKEILEKEFKPLLTTEAVPLQVLVSKPFSSARERTKVIEGLEEIKGFDLPFVLGVLMDANASGHLNIANNSGEIFGVTLSQGRIVNVDSSESEVTLTMLLIEKGFVAREDLNSNQVQKARGDLLAALIDQQMLSPHALPLIRKEQIVVDLKRLFVDESIKINFVPERKAKESEFGLGIDDLTPILHDVIFAGMPLKYLKSFYQQWNEFPIQVGTVFKPDHPIFELEMLKQLPGFAAALSNKPTIEELSANKSFKEDLLYKSLHMLAFRRLIIFDDVKKAKDAAQYSQRMSVMLKELDGKNPFEVFAYFGVSDTAKDQDIERVYRDFARANHPDLLPPSATSEVRQTVNRVFSIVSESYNTLSSVEKRQKLINSIKQEEAERQIQAEGLAEEASTFLRRGKVTESLEKTTLAMKLYPSRNVKLTYAWALLKSGDSTDKVTEANKVLDSIPHEERRNAQYLLVFGLLKKALGDVAGAQAQFDKAISLDANFLDARREKASLSEKKGKTDIFNADLGELVGNLFKKRG